MIDPHFQMDEDVLGYLVICDNCEFRGVTTDHDNHELWESPEEISCMQCEAYGYIYVVGDTLIMA